MRTPLAHVVAMLFTTGLAALVGGCTGSNTGAAEGGSSTSDDGGTTHADAENDASSSEETSIGTGSSDDGSTREGTTSLDSDTTTTDAPSTSDAADTSTTTSDSSGEGRHESSSGDVPSSDDASSGGPQVDPGVDWPLINGVQWADTDGQPIQAHGGGVLRVDDAYYWFGENRNPDGTFFAVSAYRSYDLRRWEHVHDVLTMHSDPGLDPANVERPKVVFNAQTQRYVMWMHWENGMDYGEARAAVASADTIDGDYTYHGSFRPYEDAGVVDHGKPGYMSRDCTLFVDDDGTGYFLSTSNENYDLHLYRLSDDYLTIDRREALLFEGEHREAPALFKRGDVYFMVSSGSTGWSPNQAAYATSRSLTSGWSSLRNVANDTTFYSQSTFVLPVEGTEGTSYLYMGDRWAGAWGGRVNESSYLWQPIAFPSDDTMSLTWFNTIDIDADAGTLVGDIVSFVLVNDNSGLALSVDGDPNLDSADVIQAPFTGETSQTWRLDYNGAGDFRLENGEGGKIVDVPDESEDPGVALILWDDHGGDNQAWRVIDLGEGRYRLRNKNSGLYLGTRDGAMDVAVVEQQADTAGREQIWRIDVAD